MSPPIRAYLFAPGGNERLLRKVFTVGADAVVLDLEDSVREGQKTEARKLVAEALRARESDEIPIYVRINPVGGELWQEDVKAVAAPCLRGVRAPKAESSQQLLALDQALSAIETRAGLPVGAIRIVPTIETAAGVLAAGEMARAPRVEAMCFGMADFVRDIGGEVDESGSTTLYAQSHLVLVSRATGLIPPIAPVYMHLDDLDGLRLSSETARRLGFFGRSCIHPKQVSVIQEVFTPSSEAVANAKAIIAGFEGTDANFEGAFVLKDGQFVDEAIVKRARAVVDLSESLEHNTKGKCL